MEALLTSLSVVAIAEIGDRTQLLSLVLASQFRRPLPIICGIFVATLANHAVAALAGEWIGNVLSPAVLRWALGISFIAMAVWILIADKLEDDPGVARRQSGAFVATVVGFFMCEIGDKTQIATAVLAARFDELLPVVAGTTAGIMIVNVPSVLFGHYAGHKIGGKWTRWVAAAIFAAQAILTFASRGFF
jgi:Ca2+/H+ antiporter, TMEM165/GDT1 family